MSPPESTGEVFVCCSSFSKSCACDPTSTFSASANASFTSASGSTSNNSLCFAILIVLTKEYSTDGARCARSCIFDPRYAYRSGSWVEYSASGQRPRSSRPTRRSSSPFRLTAPALPRLLRDEASRFPACDRRLMLLQEVFVRRPFFAEQTAGRLSLQFRRRAKDIPRRGLAHRVASLLLNLIALWVLLYPLLSLMNGEYNSPHSEV